MLLLTACLLVDGTLLFLSWKKVEKNKCEIVPFFSAMGVVSGSCALMYHWRSCDEELIKNDRFDRNVPE